MDVGGRAARGATAEGSGERVRNREGGIGDLFPHAPVLLPERLDAGKGALLNEAD